MCFCVYACVRTYRYTSLGLNYTVDMTGLAAGGHEDVVPQAVVMLRWGKAVGTRAREGHHRDDENDHDHEQQQQQQLVMMATGDVTACVDVVSFVQCGLPVQPKVREPRRPRAVVARGPYGMAAGDHHHHHHDDGAASAAASECGATAVHLLAGEPVVLEATAY
jgi:hypothetical protein